MIKLSSVIKRLREKCPSFQNRVGGTATFMNVTSAGEESDLPVPHCFVIPMDEQNVTPVTDEKTGSREEERQERFSTVICVDNTVPGAGSTSGVMSLIAVDQVAAIQEEIEDAFDDWVPNPAYDVIRFHRGAHVGMDNKRLWHQFEWTLRYTNIPSADGPDADAIEQQVRNITEGDDPNPAQVSQVQKIHVNRTSPDPTVNGGPGLDSPDDFFPPKPPLSQPASSVLEAKRASEDVEYTVQPLPAPDADPKTIGDAATK